MGRETEASGTIEIESGLRVPYRPIKPDDSACLQAFHRSLSERSQYQRFFRHYPELGERQADHFTNVDGHDRIALVACDPGDPGVIIAVVRVDREGDTSTAEYAAVVTDRWQGKGLGHKMTVALLNLAWSEGIRKVYALILPGNRPMLSLLEGLGRPWRVRWEEGFQRLELDLNDRLEDPR